MGPVNSTDLAECAQCKIDCEQTPPPDRLHPLTSNSTGNALDTPLLRCRWCKDPAVCYCSKECTISSHLRRRASRLPLTNRPSSAQTRAPQELFGSRSPPVPLPLDPHPF